MGPRSFNSLSSRIGMENMKSVCLDFDGVIHSYTSPWTSPEEIPDPPMPGAFEFIYRLINSDFRVVISSARFSSSCSIDAVKQWFLKHGLHSWVLSQIVFSAIKPGAVIYIDDRGFQFKGEWPSIEFIENFKPWTLPGGKNAEWK